jgi:catechol 2,3-dioxygenase-like lactoylglutathione lyase family enzyme
MRRIFELLVGDPPEAWGSVGFRLDGDVCRVGDVAIRMAGTTEGKGLLSWSVHGVESTELDGLPTVAAPEAPSTEVAGAHPNGVVSVDHLVAFSPDLERTVAACRAAGLDFRRVREGPTPAGAQRQAFFRVGETILEVVEYPPRPGGARDGEPGASPPAAADRDAPARFWGLAFTVADLDATAAMLGELVGEPRPAIQEGRRIATLRRTAGLTVPVALMSA